MAFFAFIIGSYVLGTLPQVYWLRRAKAGNLPPDGDLHESLWRLSRGLGATGFAVDLLKGPAPILLGRWLGLPETVVALGGIMVVVGQMWPVYLLRSGGGGNSTGITMAMSLALMPFLIALVPLVVGLGWRVVTHMARSQDPFGPPHSRSLPVGMAVAFASLPASSWLLGEPRAVSLGLLGLFVVVMARRLTKGLMFGDKVLAPLTPRAVLRRLLFD